MDRRKFIKTMLKATVVGVVAAKLPKTAYAAETLSGQTKAIPDLVVVRNSDPVSMFRKGIEELGGMKAFVKPGQKVIIKANASFDSGPERCANSNPELVGEVVRQAKAAGADKVDVFDHTLNEWKASYKNSGIQDAVIEAGGKMLPANEEKFYKLIKKPQASIMKENGVFMPLLEADVIINVSPLKQNGGVKMTGAIKNLLGVVWERRSMHRLGLHQCIAENLLYCKPDLNIVDAYRMMTANGPRGVSTDDVVMPKYLMISPDIVAVDSAAANVLGIKGADVEYIQTAQKLGFGQSDLKKLKVNRIEA